MHNGVTRGLGSKHCTKVKCNPHGTDIPFYLIFFCNFFAARTDYGIQSISTIFLPDDLDQQSLHSQGGFPQNILAPQHQIETLHEILAPTSQIPQNLHFRRPFNAKPIIERALCQSRVNGATKLKIYNYIDIAKYLCVCQHFSARGPPGGAEPLDVNLGPP